MQAFLETMLESTVLICVITLLRRVFLQRMPKRTFLLLWEIALFRLLIPVSIPAPSSIYNLLHRTQKTIPQTQAQFPATVLHPADIQPATSAAGHAPSPLLLLWAAGICISAGYFFLTHYRFKRLCADSLPLDTPFIRRWQQAHPLRRKVRIRQSDRMGTPLTYGVFRPTVLLPKTMPAKPEQLSFILLHEYTHIRRFDILLKILQTAARCIYWFNPVVHLMAYLAGRDIELTCDEIVLQTCGKECRSAYALTLLEQEEARIAAPSCTCFSQNTAKERITAIMKMKKLTVATAVLAIALVTGTVTVFATSRSAADTPSGSDSVSIVLTDEDAYIRALEDSIRFSGNTVSFTLPEPYTEKVSIWVAGRVVADGVSMSAHYLTDEFEADNWKSGETYSFPIDGNLSELLFSVTLGDSETILDLTERIPAEYRAVPETSGSSQPQAEIDSAQLSETSEVALPADIPAEMSETESDVPSEAPADTPSDLTEVAAEPAPAEQELYEHVDDSSISLIWPLESRAGTISVSYGEKGHNGMDIAADGGTAILAAADGIVLEAGYDIREGNYVLIQHPGYETLYSHCKSVAVQAGDTVFQGDSIGAVGRTGMATGDHLHFELRMSGQTADPYAYIQDR